MMEALSYMAGAELPVVLINIIRGGPGLGGILPAQSDYFQATKGGGHGDYRCLVLAPSSVQEAVDLTIESFDLADKYRNPVMVIGDGMIGQMMEPVEFREDVGRPELPPKDWAVDGSLGGSGRSRNINPIGMEKGAKGIEPERFWRRLQHKHDAIAAAEARMEGFEVDDAEIVVVAFGTLARFARAVVRELRSEGVRVGLCRPVTLWPFPSEELARATEGARCVAVLEQNAGQMIDDVRLAVLGRAPVLPVGGISSDEAGFGVGPLYDPVDVRRRVECALEGREVSA